MRWRNEELTNLFDSGAFSVAAKLRRLSIFGDAAKISLLIQTNSSSFAAAFFSPDVLDLGAAAGFAVTFAVIGSSMIRTFGMSPDSFAKRASWPSRYVRKLAASFTEPRTRMPLGSPFASMEAL